MASMIDHLRSLAENRALDVCAQAADEIESLEKSYASLFKDCDRAQRDRAVLVDALQAAFEYLDAIPETAAGGDDEAVRIARQACAALAKARGE